MEDEAAAPHRKPCMLTIIPNSQPSPIFTRRTSTDAWIRLIKGRAIGDRVKVDKSRQFLGLDAFQKVIDSGVDLVLVGSKYSNLVGSYDGRFP